MKGFPRPTPAQVEAVPQYIKKWYEIGTSTQRIDRTRVTTIIEEVYQLLGLHLPPLHFLDSPYGAMRKLEETIREGNYAPLIHLGPGWEEQIKQKLCLQINGYPHIGRYPEELKEKPDYILQVQLDSGLNRHITSEVWTRIFEQPSILTTLRTQTWHSLYNYGYIITPAYWACSGCYMDWLVTELGREHDPQLWQLFQSLIIECGWILPFKEICLICDRPLYILRDENRKLHAEPPQAAIGYLDGFSVYAYHGVTLPRRYGQLSPEQWPARCYENNWPNVRQVMYQILPPEKIDPGQLLRESDRESRKFLAQKLGLEVTELTLAQMETLPHYYDKWRNIAIQPGPIDREKANRAIEKFYEVGDSAFFPKILYALNPQIARRLVKRHCPGRPWWQWPYKSRLSSHFIVRAFGSLSGSQSPPFLTHPDIDLLPVENFALGILAQLSESVFNLLYDSFIVDRSWSFEFSRGWVQPEGLTTWCSFFDFCITSLGLFHDTDFWPVLQEIVRECGPFFPGGGTCIICERPVRLLLDENDRPHADKGAAIVYPDGYKRRACHGASPRKRKETKKQF